MMIDIHAVRQRAWKALKENWQIALLVCFIAAIPSIISMVVSNRLGADLLPKLYEIVNSASPAELRDPVLLMDKMAAATQSTPYALSQLVSILCWAAGPILSLGMYHYLIEMLRGNEGQISDAFSRLGCAFKSIGLNLLIMLKTMLWALPGVLVMFAGFVLAIVTGGGLSLMMMIVTLGSTLATVLGLMAWYRYALAMFILADHPHTGVFQSIRESKAAMKGKTLSLFMLQLFFVLLLVAAGFVDSVLEGILGGIIGSTIYMILQLIIQMYMYTSCCAFYLEAAPQAMEKEIEIND